MCNCNSIRYHLLISIHDELKSSSAEVTSNNVDAASMAKKWQGSGAYQGVDDWSNITIKKGTKVCGGAPGQSNFYTTEEVMKAVGNDATKLNQGLQVGKGSHLQFRPGMYKCYGCI